MTDQEILALPEVASTMRSPGVGYFARHVAAAFRAGMARALAEPSPCACGEMPDMHMWCKGGKWRASFMCLGCYEAPRGFDEADTLSEAYAGAARNWEKAVEAIR